MLHLSNGYGCCGGSRDAAFDSRFIPDGLLDLVQHDYGQGLSIAHHPMLVRSLLPGALLADVIVRHMSLVKTRIQVAM